MLSADAWNLKYRHIGDTNGCVVIQRWLNGASGRCMHGGDRKTRTITRNPGESLNSILPDAACGAIHLSRAHKSLLLSREAEAPVIPLISSVSVALALFNKVHILRMLSKRSRGVLSPGDDGLGDTGLFQVSSSIPSNLLTKFIVVNTMWNCSKTRDFQRARLPLNTKII